MGIVFYLVYSLCCMWKHVLKAQVSFKNMMPCMSKTRYSIYTNPFFALLSFFPVLWHVATNSWDEKRSNI